MLAIAVCATGFTAGFTAAHADDGTAKTRTAENGAVLPMPRIDSLACDEMHDILMKFSASDYRKAGEVPEDHPDRSIFEYENRLATAHYTDCQSGQAQFETTGETFSRGFK